MARSPFEFPVEAPDDLGDEVRRLHQSWDDRLHLDRPRLIHRYLSGKLSLWLKFRVGSLNPCEFYALFCKAYQSGPSSDAMSGGRLDGLRVPPFDAHLSHDGARTHDNEQLVLVFNVQLMESLQNGAANIPSVVRLYSLNEFNCGSGDALYFSTSRLVFEFARLGADGEPMSLMDGVALLQDQRANELIQAGPEVVDNLADKDGESGWKRNILKAMPDICASFRIVLSDESAWVRLAREERVGLKFEIIDVLFGPFNLSPASGPEIL